MASFDEAVRKGAERLHVQADELAKALAKASVRDDNWVHVTADDFVAAMAEELKSGIFSSRKPAVWDLRAAHAAINAVLQGTATELPGNVSPAQATAEQLIMAVDVRQPGSEVMDELLRREVAGRALAETPFFVLHENGELDRQGTRRVIELLRRGMPPGEDEVLDPGPPERTYVVYRSEDLPAAQEYVDPLFPDEVLKLGVSTRFQVVVRPKLTDEQAQLLLFLRLRGKVAEPLDKATCMDLIDLVRTRSLREILERHGAIGAYEKALRLPVGATSGLPTITRATRTAMSSSSGGAYQHGASSPFDKKKSKGRGAGPSSAVF